MTEFDYREIRLRDGRVLAYSEYGSPRGLPIIHCHVPAAHGRYLAGAISTCRARFYPDEAHLSLPLNHQREILSALAG
jgi:hypothetical protein